MSERTPSILTIYKSNTKQLVGMNFISIRFKSKMETVTDMRYGSISTIMEQKRSPWERWHPVDSFLQIKEII
ncbi:hypothetical protein KKB99_00245 [bacterium]|nr:hypothetical protein [bacterium]MBU1024414.1 hypothetical protein [bacterium]